MNKAYLKKLGNNIKHARKNKNMSQEKLAELIKKTRNYVGMVERAELNIPASVIFDIANALNVEAKIFFEF
ncbi:MAG: helix-turn-helix transcriptional regulator [Candidatus Gastranaerophilales bacterium]|nr:helix-turn-helix transcriptional regulator [Candidatus Gastranaerophilales bacterium]